MTTPNVPYRFEFEVEVPGSPDVVWDAVASANGISSWMMETELEEREGGRVVFHMGPEDSSEGTVTGWEPPHRLVYQEPNWAALAGQDPTAVTPLVTEFLVEAGSGGTCVVKVVSSAFGQGAEWEREFFDEMAKGWGPMFEHLRLYLTHFPGQKVTRLEAAVQVRGTPATAVASVRRALGIEAPGETIEVIGSKGEVERVADESVLLRLTDPVAGLLAFMSYASGEGEARLWISGYLFSDTASAYVEREQPRWQAWLEGLGLEVAQAG